MPVSVSRRALSLEERRSLDSPLWTLLLWAIPGVLGRFLLSFLACMLAMMVVVTTLAKVFEEPRPTTPQAYVWPKPEPIGAREIAMILVLWGPVFALPGYLTYRGFRPRVRAHRTRRADLEANEAWVVHARDAAFIEMRDDNEGPIFLLDLGDGRSLLVQGEMIGWDFDLFGLPEPDELPDDTSEEWRAVLTPFPNTDLAIELLPRSGRLLRIQARGETVPAARVVQGEAFPVWKHVDFVGGRNSAILQGNPDELLASAAAMASRGRHGR